MHSRRLNKIWLEDSKGNIYDTNMQMLDKDVVIKKDKELELRVRKSVKIWERRIKEGNIAGRIDKKPLSQKEFLILKLMMVVFTKDLILI